MMMDSISGKEAINMSARMYGHGYHNKEMRERTKKGWEGRGFANHRMDKNKRNVQQPEFPGGYPPKYYSAGSKA